VWSSRIFAFLRYNGWVTGACGDEDSLCAFANDGFRMALAQLDLLGILAAWASASGALGLSATIIWIATVPRCIWPSGRILERLPSSVACCWPFHWHCTGRRVRFYSALIYLFSSGLLTFFRPSTKIALANAGLPGLLAGRQRTALALSFYPRRSLPCRLWLLRLAPAWSSHAHLSIYLIPALVVSCFLSDPIS